MPSDFNTKRDALKSILTTTQVEQIRNALGLLVIQLEQHRDLKRSYSYSGNWDAEEFEMATSLYRLFDSCMVKSD